MNKKRLKTLTKPINLLILVLILAGVAGLLILIIKNLRQFKGPQKVSQPLVEIRDKDRTFTLKRNGEVEFRTPEGIFEQEWSNNKANGLLQYLKKKYEILVSEREEGGFVVTFLYDGQLVTFTLSVDDELINLLFEEIKQGAYAAHDEGTGVESIIDYFRKASPTPTSQEEAREGLMPGEEAATGGVAQASPEADFFQDYSSKGDAFKKELTEIVCPYWRLSYCVYPQGYSPPPPKTIFWQGATVVVVPDCELWEKQVIRRTVISNTICIEEPAGE